MITTETYFKNTPAGWEETNEKWFYGLKGVDVNGINFRIIQSTFLAGFGNQKWTFVLSKFVQDSQSLKWTWVEDKLIEADNKTYRDANGNLFVDSGDNENPDNAYLYTNGTPIMEGDDIIGYNRIKTLKQGLTVTEWVQFYDLLYLGACVPELKNSIINKGMFGITEIN